MASSDDLSKDERALVDGDLAQISEAWAHIAKGEKTAQALESNLTSLEKKIDALLATFEESERRKVEEADGKKPNGSSPSGNGEARS